MDKTEDFQSPQDIGPLSPRIHEDIIDTVLGHLQGNKRLLSRCSLVCKTWLPFARRFLFRSIAVNVQRMGIGTEYHPAVPGLRVLDLDALTTFLQNAPHLTGSVRKLKVTGLPLPFDREDLEDADDYNTLLGRGEDYEESNGPPAWSTFGVDQLADILQLLPVLDILILRDMVLSLHATLTHKPIVLGHLNLINVGTLRNDNILHLFDILDPTHLHLDIFRICPPLQDTNSHYPAFLAPTTLNIEAGSDTSFFLEALRLSPGVPKIAVLDVQISVFKELKPLSGLLGRLRSSLQCLSLDLCDAELEDPLGTDIQDIFARNFDLSLHVGLWHFSLLINFGIEDYGADQTIQDICAILACLPSSVPMVDITFNFLQFEAYDLVLAPWDDLDRAFGRFSSLLKLNLTVFAPPGGAFSRKKQKMIQTVLETKLPQVQKLLGVSFLP